ncbi:MAG: transposase [Thiothrix sp.]
MLRKRSIIETINDQLKNISQIEHTRHQVPHSTTINVISLAGLHLSGQETFFEPDNFSFGTI